MRLSNGYSDEEETNSSACAKPDELVFRVSCAALLVEYRPLRVTPIKIGEGIDL